MKLSAEQIATDWIAYARYPSPVEEAPEQVLADAMSMIELSYEEPDLSWATIKNLIDRYSEEDLFSDEKTEAKWVIGVVAAGPLEDLLGHHGSRFIEKIEMEAQRDRRMAWALGGVWQFRMSDDIWRRVQAASWPWQADEP